MMVSPRFLKGCDAQIGTRIMSKWILTVPLFIMTMVGNMVDLVKKIGESIERTLANLKESLGAKLPNAPLSLESDDVGLTFQLKMLEFMDSMNKELLVGNEMRADKTKWWSPHNARC
jgi:hypothetical protein